MRNKPGERIADAGYVREPVFGDQPVDRNCRQRKIVRRTPVRAGAKRIFAGKIHPVAEFAQHAGNLGRVQLRHKPENREPMPGSCITPGQFGHRHQTAIHAITWRLRLGSSEMLRSRSLAAVLALISLPAFAAAIEDGRDAYHKGDYATALRILRPLADDGNPEAQVFIGMSYEFGDGIGKDTKQAINWYRKAADKGNADAAYNLGTMYEDGEGVAKNIPEAMKWFRMAAAKGDALSQRELGTLYRDGTGIKRDPEQAAKWFRMATGKNDVPSMTALGEMYLAGQGVMPDRKEAQDLLRRASELGDPDAKKIYDREFSAGK